MFWGVTLETGKLYRQVVESSYHLSNAALEPSTTAGRLNSRVGVIIEHNKSEYLLCTLDHDRVPQAHLDHCFVEGEEVSYHLNGEGTVHLTGYIISDDIVERDSDNSSESGEEEEVGKLSLAALAQEDDSEEDDDWDPKKESALKRKLETNGKSKPTRNMMSVESKPRKTKSEELKKSPQEKKSPKAGAGDADKRAQLKREALSKVVAAEEDSSDDEDDEDFMMGNEDDSDDESDSEEEDSDDEDSDEEDENGDLDLDIEEFSSVSTSKKAKMEKPKSPFSPIGKSPKPESPSKKLNQSQQKGSAKKEKQKGANTPSQANKSLEKKSPENAKKSPMQTPPSSGKKSFGVDIQDTLAGNGPIAKPGKMVHVYYRGTLPNKSEFDSCLKGKPFSFRLGKNEVIKGWDIGIQGMKVGGKRTLVVPPAMGYGNKPTGPIPANSTLHFEVELKSVS